MAEKDGATAAVARYRKLRDEYYGSGSYDFSSGTLVKVAETLAAKDDLAGAMTILELNLEVHPKEAVSLVMMGQIQTQQGDHAAARASLEKALELEPDNGYAKRLLSQLPEVK